MSRLKKNFKFYCHSTLSIYTVLSHSFKDRRKSEGSTEFTLNYQ